MWTSELFSSEPNQKSNENDCNKGGCNCLVFTIDTKDNKNKND